MSAIKFSVNQQKALSLENVNTLVSAGAGSGKTAVLIERLFNILTIGNVPTDKVLVLTFTKLAAEELKTRIKIKLQNSTEFTHLTNKVDISDISTFDSFALNIVKKYGYHLNYNPDISILDQSIETVIFKEAFDQVIGEYYENPTPAFKDLFSNFIDRNEKRIYGVIESIHAQANLKINPDDFIRTFIVTYYNQSSFNKYVKGLDKQILTLINQMKSEVKLFNNEKAFETLEPVVTILSGVRTLDDLCKLGEKIKKPRVPSGLSNDFEDDLTNTRITKLFKELEYIQKFESVSSLNKTFDKNREYALILIEIYEKIVEKLMHFKTINNVYTFTEIARFANELVALEEVNKEVSEQFTYIMIDEYQDTSDIQESFINKIARDNVYMVGDIKQSIYGFRNANPNLFEDKYERYGKGQGGKRVDLNDNYRSRGEVIENINEILSEIMTKKYGGAHYIKDHIINAGNKNYTQQSPNQLYGLDVRLYQKDETRRRKDAEIEFSIIIDDIKRKIASKYLVLDPEFKIFRACEYRDFTILMAKRMSFNLCESLFNKAGIPLFPLKEDEVANQKVMQVIRSLLIIYDAFTREDNPDHYVFRHATASFLRSYVIEYTDQMLFDLLNPKDKKLKDDPIINKIYIIAQNYKDKPLMDGVNVLVKEFRLFETIYKIGDLLPNTHKLQMILSEIDKLISFGYDLSEIINHFEVLEYENKSLKIKPVKLVKNAVNLMTIHNSKGLEFPIVYYAGNSSTSKGDYSRFRITKDYGFLFPEPNKRTTFTSLLEHKQTKSEILSERIRLLYVALTRAREAMIVISKTLNEGKEPPLTEDAKTINQLLQSSSFFLSKGKLETPTFNYTKDHEQTIQVTDDQLPTLHILKKQDLQLGQTKKSSNLPLIDESILKRGELMHKYFEIYDFSSRDLSYITNENDRKHIKQLLQMPLFSLANNENVFREYQYFDQELGQEQIIDCFILLDKEIILIDFKLANIDHPRYDEQVINYKKHLIKMFNRPVTAYLISINNLMKREVI